MLFLLLLLLLPPQSLLLLPPSQLPLLQLSLALLFSLLTLLRFECKHAQRPLHPTSPGQSFLTRLKETGVDRLAERQKLANALGRLRRERNGRGEHRAQLAFRPPLPDMIAQTPPPEPPIQTQPPGAPNADLGIPTASLTGEVHRRVQPPMRQLLSSTLERCMQPTSADQPLGGFGDPGGGLRGGEAESSGGI